jgi:hypothetical protein
MDWDGTDITGDVIALLRASGPEHRLTDKVEVALQRGIPIQVADAKRLREDLWCTMEIVGMATIELAFLKGLTFDQLVDEWEVFTGLQAPPTGPDEPDFR